MGLHQDKDEGPESIAAGIPVVSVSIGDTARFLFGGLKRRDPVDAHRARIGRCVRLRRARAAALSRRVAHHSGHGAAGARAVRPVQSDVPPVRRKHAARCRSRRRRGRHDGGDLRRVRGRRDAAPRTHERRRPQNSDQRRRTLQHPSRAARRVAVRHRLVAASCCATSSGRGRSTSRSRSSSASWSCRSSRKRNRRKLFPKSQSARDVRDKLLAHARRKGVTDRDRHARHRYPPQATDRLDRRAQRRRAPLEADAVVLATGGLSVPKTGSDGRGLRIASGARTCRQPHVCRADAVAHRSMHPSHICQASRYRSPSRALGRARGATRPAAFSSPITATADLRCSTCRTWPCDRAQKRPAARRLPSNGRR